jgi:hypothetical protein
MEKGLNGCKIKVEHDADLLLKLKTLNINKVLVYKNR